MRGWSDSEASGTPHEYMSYRSPEFLALQTGCYMLLKDNNNFATLDGISQGSQVFGLCFALCQLETNFSFDAPTPLFFYLLTAVFEGYGAIGAMLRVCCVICCYAPTSGMWILCLFFTLAFFLSKGDQQRCHNRKHRLAQCVMGVREAVCLGNFI